jgi:hypothetical protein
MLYCYRHKYGIFIKDLQDSDNSAWRWQMLKDKTSVTDLGGSNRFLIPISIYKDSAYPFKDSDELEMEIVDGTIIVRKKVE